MIEAFHEVRFPTNISIGAVGGPRRSTEVVEMVSGKEQRNARQKYSRRRYNAGYGMKSIDDLYSVVSFFEERRGRLCGFRFKDPLDYSSAMPSDEPAPSDQIVGTGDGINSQFQVSKTYGVGQAAYQRPIHKLVEGSVQIEVDGVLQSENGEYSVNVDSGLIEFLPGSVPVSDAVVRAGFLFDVPVRFDTDQIAVSMTAFRAGEIPDIPLVELVL